LRNQILAFIEHKDVNHLFRRIHPDENPFVSEFTRRYTRMFRYEGYKDVQFELKLAVVIEYTRSFEEEFSIQQVLSGGGASPPPLRIN
jgi:hypothetical protein